MKASLCCLGRSGRGRASSRRLRAAKGRLFDFVTGDRRQGRPRLAEIRCLVLRMANENQGGHVRSTIGSILRAESVPPSHERPTTWAQRGRMIPPAGCRDDHRPQALALLEEAAGPSAVPESRCGTGPAPELRFMDRPGMARTRVPTRQVREDGSSLRHGRTTISETASSRRLNARGVCSSPASRTPGPNVSRRPACSARKIAWSCSWGTRPTA